MEGVFDRKVFSIVVGILALAVMFSAFQDTSISGEFSGRLSSTSSNFTADKAPVRPQTQPSSQFPPSLKCGDTITKNTILKQDILKCEKEGLYIGSDNIELNCNNHTISGKKGNKASGIVFGGDAVPNAGFRSITLKNCNIHGFKIGINQANIAATNNTISNNLISGSSNGIYLMGTYNTISNNLIYNNNDGIAIRKLNNSLLYNNQFLNNSEGLDILWSYHNNFYNNQFNENDIDIEIIFSENNTFSNNKFTKNSLSGLSIFSSYNNVINNNTFESCNEGVYSIYSGDIYYNNIFENNTGGNSYEDGNCSNHWNTTIGNYWDDFGQNPGYPNYYEIPGSGPGIDYHPQ